jgi:hypothetical protein
MREPYCPAAHCSATDAGLLLSRSTCAIKRGLGHEKAQKVTKTILISELWCFTFLWLLVPFFGLSFKKAQLKDLP